MPDLNRLPLPRLFDRLTADGSLDRLLEAARVEDLADVGDVTTASIIGDAREVRASGIAREPGVVAGLAAIPRILNVFGCPAAFEPLTRDGRPCSADQTLWRLLGELAPILTVERTILNLVGRLSGIATLTRRYVDQVANTKAVICDTRKTTPGLRALEKYAVRCGGGHLHRLGLYDAALFKDNHLAYLTLGELAPAITAACRKVRTQHDLRFVEVEVDTLEQLGVLLDCPPGLIDIVLLDNMPLDQLREAVAMRDKAAVPVLLEASGRVDLQTVSAVAETGVDRIAVGALTRAAMWLDFGLDLT